MHFHFLYITLECAMLINISVKVCGFGAFSKRGSSCKDVRRLYSFLSCSYLPCAQTKLSWVDQLFTCQRQPLASSETWIGCEDKSSISTFRSTCLLWFSGVTLSGKSILVFLGLTPVYRGHEWSTTLRTMLCHFFKLCSPNTSPKRHSR